MKAPRFSFTIYPGAVRVRHSTKNITIMKNKHLLLLVGLLFLVPLSLRAYNFKSGDLYYNITSVTEPYTVEVTYEYMDAMGNYSGLTTAVIPETVTRNGTTFSVTSIGDNAFSICTTLTSITIPNSVTSIGDAAFLYCPALTSITIPESVTSIGNTAFVYCPALTSIVVESGNSVYDSRSNCNAIIETATNTLIVGNQSTIIPNRVTSIGDYAFFGCSGLTFITIPNRVMSIGDYAFCGCSGITFITIPNSVTKIGGDAFSGCSGLAAVTIGNGVQNIGAGAFSDCSGLTAVTIGNSVQSIGDRAFSGCSGLAAMTIPNSVTDMGTEVFAGCRGLTSITLSNKLTAIGNRAFYDCKNLYAVSVPHSVTSIGSQAFGECGNLHSVTIGSSVARIGEQIFYGCRQLQTVYCYPMLPPSVPSFILSDYGIANLYVPCEALDVYQKNALWNTTFSSIQCISSEETALPDNDVVVTPSTDNAVFAWPSVSAAAAYTLVISQEGNEFCTLVFNADGQLNSLTFKSPRRTAESCRTTGATASLNGWSFTVTGLREGTAYTYALTVTDSMDKVLKTYTGTFKTQGTSSTAIEHVAGDTPSGTKILRDGQVLILREGKTYNMLGQEVM